MPLLSEFRDTGVFGRTIVLGMLRNPPQGPEERVIFGGEGLPVGISNGCNVGDSLEVSSGESFYDVTGAWFRRPIE